MNRSTRKYLDGPVYAQRRRLANSRAAEVSRISSCLIPIRTPTEVAKILGCSTQNLWVSEKRALWKLITRLKQEIL